MARVPKWQQRHDKKKEIFTLLTEFDRATRAVAFAGSQTPAIADVMREHYHQTKQQLILSIEELSRI